MLARLVLVTLATATAPACIVENERVGPGAEFVESREFRRAVLEESLVNPANGYSQLRLANYARDDGGGPIAWDALPVWNPPTRPSTIDDDGATDSERSAIDVDIEWTHDEILRLGERAFREWPLSDDSSIEWLLQDSAALERLGVWTDSSGRLGCYVSYLDEEGRVVYAKTCATCHARTQEDGALVLGASNVDFDLGRLQYEAALAAGSTAPVPEEILDWGPGHVDSTSDGVRNPTGIPDLRPIRHHNHLHASGSVRNSLMALAVRTETLMITSRAQRHRPPREIAFAVAYYLWTLGAPVAKAALTSQEARGREVFQIECDGCHHEDGSTESPVALAIIGTDPAAGMSPMRGTGAYRIPSLWGIGDRRRLFHRGQVRSLEEKLRSDRPMHTPGHLFGLQRSEADKRDLIAFLRTL